MLKAAASEGLVPALVSSFFCLFPLHSPHPVGRQSYGGVWGASSVSHCISFPSSPVFPSGKGRQLGNKIHRSCLSISV